jgi:hypothetical protein
VGELAGGAQPSEVGILADQPVAPAGDVGAVGVHHRGLQAPDGAIGKLVGAADEQRQRVQAGGVVLLVPAPERPA